MLNLNFFYTFLFVISFIVSGTSNSLMAEETVELKTESVIACEHDNINHASVYLKQRLGNSIEILEGLVIPSEVSEVEDSECVWKLKETSLSRRAVNKQRKVRISSVNLATYTEEVEKRDTKLRARIERFSLVKGALEFNGNGCCNVKEYLSNWSVMRQASLTINFNDKTFESVTCKLSESGKVNGYSDTEAVYEELFTLKNLKKSIENVGKNAHIQLNPLSEKYDIKCANPLDAIRLEEKSSQTQAG